MQPQTCKDCGVVLSGFDSGMNGMTTWGRDHKPECPQSRPAQSAASAEAAQFFYKTRPVILKGWCVNSDKAIIAMMEAYAALRTAQLAEHRNSLLMWKKADTETITHLENKVSALEKEVMAGYDAIFPHVPEVLTIAEKIEKLIERTAQLERERDDRQQKVEKLQYELSQEKVMTVAYQARSLEMWKRAETAESSLAQLRERTIREAEHICYDLKASDTHPLEKMSECKVCISAELIAKKIRALLLSSATPPPMQDNQIPTDLKSDNN